MLAERVERALVRVPPGAHLLLGYSGGLDSSVLLSLLAAVAPKLRFSLRAVHVHHGLSVNADAWAEFCTRSCERLRVPLSVEKVDLRPWRSLGVEAAARAARYAAFDQHACDFLVLAHQRDDQAETLLLQLLRGAGVAGLASMASVRAAGDRIILRPLLDEPRAEIEAYARAKGLQWIEDESNDDVAHDRNFVRNRVLPVIEERFAGAREVIARSAAHLGEASALLDALARLDLDQCSSGEGWELDRFLALGEMRGRNALRALCRGAGLRPPPASRLRELWRQLGHVRSDAQLRFEVEEWAFLVYRRRLLFERVSAEPPPHWRISWHGEASLPLLELGGVLRFKPEEGRGLSVERLQAAPVTVRLRRGGERLKPDARRPRRTLKNLLQERAVPSWRRTLLPLVYCGETLVCVPGVGEESDWRAARGTRGLIVTWEPI